MKNIILWLIVLMVLLGVTVYGGLSSRTVAQESNQAELYWIDWSADGSRIAAIEGFDLVIYDADYRELARNSTLDRENRINFSELSPDGMRLLSTNAVWSIETLQPLFSIDIATLGEWSPDSSRIAALSIDSDYTDGMRPNVLIFDTENGSLMQTIEGEPAIIMNPIWSPDGTRLAAFQNSGMLLILEVASGDVIGRYSSADSHATSPVTWSPDGTYLAYITLTPDVFSFNSIQVIDVETGALMKELKNAIRIPGKLLWSPDGSQLLAYSRQELYIWDVNSGELLHDYELPAPIAGITYSPFGAQIMVGLSFNYLGQTFAMDVVRTAETDYVETRLGGAVQHIVPAPSLERLALIQAACTAQSDVAVTLAAPQSERNLDAYIAQVEAAPADALPPGCAADLLAIARALMAG